MRILIADDDALSRRILEASLVQLGHDVVSVADGSAALKALSETRGPRLAILDWMMPGVDGLSICRAMRQRPAPYVYVILLTSRDRHEDLVTALEAGVDDFLTKPFEIIELRGRLQSGARVLSLQENLLQAQETLRHEATHDCLTGLWNRRMISERLAQEVRQAARDRRPLSVVMIDVDRFKDINDSGGHQAGDAVLHHVADRLQGSLRADDRIGRYGGDEFLVVLTNCGGADAEQAAERARTAIVGAPVQTDRGRVSVSISLGVASTEHAGHDVANLIAEADAGLYAAKAGGRDQVVCV